MATSGGTSGGKPPAKKKAAARKRAAKPAPPRKRQAQARKDEAARKRRGEELPATSPKRRTGKRRLTAAQQSARDSLMVARLAQSWPWEAIAEEAGLSVSAAKKAVKLRQDAAPIRLNADPVKVVEDVFTAYQLSIGDLEAIAFEATQRGNLAVAVGSKKAANDAREKVLTLLQITGRLPQELGTLRHLIDLRAIAVRMLDVMDRFERGLAALQLDSETRTAIDAGVLEVRSTFNELVGIDPPEQPVLEGTATPA